jgi:hypothetical protein
MTDDKVKPPAAPAAPAAPAKTGAFGTVPVGPAPVSRAPLDKPDTGNADGDPDTEQYREPPGTQHSDQYRTAFPGEARQP